MLTPPVDEMNGLLFRHPRASTTDTDSFQELDAISYDALANSVKARVETAVPDLALLLQPHECAGEDIRACSPDRYLFRVTMQETP